MSSCTGHTRPLLNFATKLVALRRVDVTFLVTESMYNLARQEISRSFDAGNSLLNAIRQVMPPSSSPNKAELHTFRLVAVPAIRFMEAHDITEWEALNAALSKIYPDLAAGRPVTCSKSGVQFDALPAPTVAILDVRPEQYVHQCPH